MKGLVKDWDEFLDKADASIKGSRYRADTGVDCHGVVAGVSLIRTTLKSPTARFVYTFELTTGQVTIIEHGVGIEVESTSPDALAEFRLIFG